VEVDVDPLLDEEREDRTVLAIVDDRALRMRADLGERRRVIELAGKRPRRAQRDDRRRPHERRGHQHDGRQQCASHAACPKGNAGASAYGFESVVWGSEWRTADLFMSSSSEKRGLRV